MNLPTPIADFFRRKNEHDYNGLLSLFTQNAAVTDAGESKKMQGAEEIQTWIQKSISGLNLHTEVRDCKQQDGMWVVDTVVTGDFKASPARFEYFITLSGEEISALCVEFGGSI